MNSRECCWSWNRLFGTLGTRRSIVIFSGFHSQLPQIAGWFIRENPNKHGVINRGTPSLGTPHIVKYCKPTAPEPSRCFSAESTILAGVPAFDGEISTKFGTHLGGSDPKSEVYLYDLALLTIIPQIHCAVYPTMTIEIALVCKYIPSTSQF